MKIAELGEDALETLERRYVLRRSELDPQIFWRLADNWVAMTVRFLVPDWGIRSIKTDTSRDIIEQLDRAGISLASGTYEVVGMPPLKVQMLSSDGNASASAAMAPAKVGAQA